MTSLDRCYQLIQKPVITEKATGDTAVRNAYHFRVPMDANKVEIRQAVERLFEVRVRSVNTLRVRGKARRRGYSIGRTQSWKKAMVTLAEGQTIDIL
ncbi:MAG: 50S ribosomal protein L23 [Planctomycetota bacterium]